jgi:hypothetical protein
MRIECIRALDELLKYRSHYSWCEIGYTDFCTCGMKQAADKARILIREYNAEKEDDTIPD